MLKRVQIESLRRCQYQSKTILQFEEVTTVQPIEMENFYSDQANTTIQNKDDFIVQSARIKVNLPPKRQQQQNKKGVESASMKAPNCSIRLLPAEQQQQQQQFLDDREQILISESLSLLSSLNTSVSTWHHLALITPSCPDPPPPPPQSFNKIAESRSSKAEAQRTTISKCQAANHPSSPFLGFTPAAPASVAFSAAVVENSILASSSPYQESSDQKRSLLTKFVRHSPFLPSSSTLQSQTNTSAQTMDTMLDLPTNELMLSPTHHNATGRFKHMFQKLRGINNECIDDVPECQQQKKRRFHHGNLVRSASFIGIISDRSSNSTINSIAPEKTVPTASKNAAFREDGGCLSLASKIRNKFRPQYQPTKVHNTNHYFSSTKHQTQIQLDSVLTEANGNSGDAAVKKKEVEVMSDRRERASKSGFSVRRSASLSSLTQHFRSSASLKKLATIANTKHSKAAVYTGNPSETALTRSATNLTTCLSHSTSSSSFSASSASSTGADTDDEDANEDRANALNDIILGQHKGSTRKIHSMLGLKKSISSHKLYMNKSQQQPTNDDRVIVDEGYFGGSTTINNCTSNKYNTTAPPCQLANNESRIDSTMPSTIATNAGGAVIKTGPSPLPPYSEAACVSAISHLKNRRRGSTASSVGSTNQARAVLRRASCLTTATTNSSQNNKQIPKVRFLKLVMVRETFSKADYDRASDPNAVCTRLTPFIAEQIKDELNTFKLYEMKVHDFSRGNTQFFL